MYWYNRNWDEWVVLYREVFFIPSVLYQRFHCIYLVYLFNSSMPMCNI